VSLAVLVESQQDSHIRREALSASRASDLADQHAAAVGAVHQDLAELRPSVARA
jgi:hypothetical protein